MGYWQEIDSHPLGRIPEDGALAQLIISKSRFFSTLVADLFWSLTSHGRCMPSDQQRKTEKPEPSKTVAVVDVATPVSEQVFDG